MMAVPEGVKRPERFPDRKRKLGLRPDQRFFNAGMIVFDPAVWRETDVAARTVEIIRTESHRFTGQDQDALNLLFQDRWLPLSHRWNFMPGFFNLGLDAAVDPAMYHFAGKGKPWDGPSWLHGDHFTDWFAEAFAASPWPELADHSRQRAGPPQAGRTTPPRGIGPLCALGRPRPR